MEPTPVSTPVPEMEPAPSSEMEPTPTPEVKDISLERREVEEVDDGDDTLFPSAPER